jgi:DNA processing protein
LSDRQRLNWLRLIRSENVGPATFRALVNQFGGAEAALDALPALSRRGGRPSIRVFTEAEAEAELEAAGHAGARLVAMGEKGYPPALSHVDAPPPVLYAKGRLELADGPIIAMVGARNGSAVGQKLTRQLATELGLEGFIIASGLARGIDTAAHLAALERGTIAVLAGGIDIVYPPENADLQRAIGKQGLLLSERSPGFAPRGKDFPRRNRLISGISLGVVVVEAAERSGSLITARFAGEQGREVFAVPGSPLDPRSAGTNNLLKQGACLVTGARDIVEALAPILGRPVEPFGPEDHRRAWTEPGRYRRGCPHHRDCGAQGAYRSVGDRSRGKVAETRTTTCVTYWRGLALSRPARARLAPLLGPWRAGRR